ncbi:hypothetical protein BD779DRAFT_1613783 [Infundibulicybe gibba]|nr:hypothetical protein BD779DRAFT_1613783 [Infundibulicybe gibba]
MATTASSYYFRRRTMGRAASPPTWACYEQISHDEEDYSDSCSESCSEDEEDYSHVAPHSDSEEGPAHAGDTALNDLDMDIDEEDVDGSAERKAFAARGDTKGKQRAIELESEMEHTRKRHRRKQPVYTLRPILTIQRSQGFVWNQDLFVPPYIKDRYVASTSPPNSRGFVSTSVSSTNSALTDYEVEVVEIRVREGELEDIIP